MLGEPAERVGAMTPRMRRSVVMALLSSIGPGVDPIDRMPPSRTRQLAWREWWHADSGGGYDLDCLEAAYRLIEEDPDLRKEWFGR